MEEGGGVVSPRSPQTMSRKGPFPNLKTRAWKDAGGRPGLSPKQLLEA